MKLLTGAILALLLLPASLRAQLTAGLQLAQEQFLPGEDLTVALRLTNFSGQTLKLGRDNAWLRITLENRAGAPVQRRQELDVRGDFDLENATIATKRLNLTPAFETLRPGRYTARAMVTIADWSQEIAAVPAEFNVIDGTVFWEQAFGVPLASGEARPPEVRRYALQKAIYLTKPKLYARVTDATGQHIFAAFPIGPLLTFSDPEHPIDAAGRLHVLYQYDARSFYHCVIDPDGKLVERRTHDYLASSRPTLVQREGKIMVSGGVRRPAQDDFPAEPAPTLPAADAPEAHAAEPAKAAEAPTSAPTAGK